MCWLVININSNVLRARAECQVSIVASILGQRRISLTLPWPKNPDSRIVTFIKYDKPFQKSTFDKTLFQRG